MQARTFDSLVVYMAEKRVNADGMWYSSYKFITQYSANLSYQTPCFLKRVNSILLPKM
jgi:hypothetical protein